MNRKHYLFRTEIFTAGIVLPLILAVWIGGYTKVYAISASGALSIDSPKKNVYDIGDVITLKVAISSDKPFDVEGQISGDSGVSIGSASISNFRSNGRFYDTDKSGTWSFTFTVGIESAGRKTVSFYADCSSKDPAELSAVSRASGSVSFYVRTAEEREAAIREYEAEQQRIREEQARRASIEASIAASRAEEISIAASIDQSIKESSDEEERRASSIAESILASESEVERTKPSEIGDLEYAELKLKGERPDGTRYFYFALADSDVICPDGSRPVAFSVNGLRVLSLRLDGMNRETYLVYGMFDGEDQPEFYYYHSKSERFFPYAYLNSNWQDDPSESGEATEPSETEAVPGEESGSFRDPENLKRLIEIAVFSLLLGMAIVTLISVAISGRKRVEAPSAMRSETPGKPSAATDTASFKEKENADTVELLEFEEIDGWNDETVGPNEVEVDDREP